jgi:hypothetical protein
MKKLIPILIFIILFSACKKSSSDFIWENTYTKGEAFFINAAADSGFIACGETGYKPYLIRLDKNKGKIFEFSSFDQGLLSSVWFDTTSYIAGGNTHGKMLLLRIDRHGNIVWDTTLSAAFKVDYTTLSYDGHGSFLAVGTASADSAGKESAGLMFVRFDTTGKITTKTATINTGFISASKVVEDNTGNIYLAITRADAGIKAKATVQKLNSSFQKIWETELYNNPEFGASTLDIVLDGSGVIYVSGKTELSQKDGVVTNSFLASLTNSGTIRWKKYLEISNSGSSLILNSKDFLVMLNMNCFILNILNPDDGSDEGRIKVLDVCDSKISDALGMALDQNFDGNILLAGSRGGSFYLALKSSSY